MAELLRIFVRGNPEPMPRVRGRIAGKGRKAFVTFYNAEKYPREHKQAGRELPWLVWKKRVIAAVKSVWRADTCAKAVRVDIDFFFDRPQYLLTAKSPPGKIPHDVKPDKDNCEKLILDALVECGVLADDGIAAQGETDKWWPRRGDPCGAWIIVQTLAGAEPVLFDNGSLLEGDVKRPTSLAGSEHPGQTGKVPQPLGSCVERQSAPAEPDKIRQGNGPRQPVRLNQETPKLVHPTTLRTLDFLNEMCRCGHVRGAHKNKGDDCDDCPCTGFQKRTRPVRAGTFDGVPLEEDEKKVVLDFEGQAVRTV